MRFFLFSAVIATILLGWVPAAVSGALLLLRLAYLTGRAAGIRETAEALETLTEAPEYIARQREAAPNQ